MFFTFHFFTAHGSPAALRPLVTRLARSDVARGRASCPLRLRFFFLQFCGFCRALSTLWFCGTGTWQRERLASSTHIERTLYSFVLTISGTATYEDSPQTTTCRRPQASCCRHDTRQPERRARSAQALRTQPLHPRAKPHVGALGALGILEELARDDAGARR